MYVSPTSYVFEPSSGGVSFSGDGYSRGKSAGETLHIDRKTGQITLNGKLRNVATEGEADMQSLLLSPLVARRSSRVTVFLA